jgi:hypothetical protein
MPLYSCMFSPGEEGVMCLFECILEIKLLDFGWEQHIAMSECDWSRSEVVKLIPQNNSGAFISDPYPIATAKEVDRIANKKV